MAIMWVTQESLSPYQRVPRIQQERRVQRSASASPVMVDEGDIQDPSSNAPYVLPSSPYNRSETSSPEIRASRVSKVEQLMTSHVITLDELTSVESLHNTFRRHDFRHLPVVNQRNRLVGIVSELDLSRDQPKSGALVREIMKSPVLTATVDTLIREAAQVMLDERIGCLPVLGRLERVIGIVTRSDILRTVVAQAPLEAWA